MTHQNDTWLLRRWAAQHDPEAFDELVSRYAAQVYATCKRILRNEADAEEVAQDCFFRLAQAEADIRTSVGGWLHRVATTKSLDRLRSEARRVERESAYHRAIDSDHETPWDDVQPLVDEAINALPDELRVPLVAHFLDRKSHQIIARELHVSRRTVSYRVERGVAAVRTLLQKKGVGVGAAALAGMLVAHTAEAAPVSLVSALGKMGIAGAVTTHSAESGVSTGLTGGLLVMKAKVAALVVIACVLVAGFYFARPKGSDATSAPSNSQADTQTPKSQTARATRTEAPSLPPADSPTTNPETSKNALLAALSAQTQPKPDRRPSHYKLIPDKADYASVSGVISDEQGYAVPGASVTLAPMMFEDSVFKVRANRVTTQSGADGSYVLQGIGYEGEYFVRAAKEGYADTLSGGAARVQLFVKAKTTLENVNITLAKGTLLSGRVLNADGAAVPDGLIQVQNISDEHGGSIVWYITADTDAQGAFSLGFAKSGFAELRVTSEKFGSGIFHTEIQDDHPVELRLERQATIYGVVKDKKGLPVPEVTVNLQGGRRNQTGVSTFDTIADSNGKYSIQIESKLIYRGQVSQADRPLTAWVTINEVKPGEQREWNPVVSGALPRVRGSVLGATSNKPLQGPLGGIMRVVCLRDGKRAQFTGGIVNPNGAFELSVVDGPGTYRFQPDYDFGSHVLSKAKGTISDPITLSEGEVKELVLKAPEPQTASVRVVTSDGAALSGAQVNLTTNFLGKFTTGILTMDDGHPAAPIVMPPFGGFQFLIEKEGYVSGTGAQHDDGEPGTVYPEEEIMLWPAAGIEGTLLRPDGQPLASAPVELTFTTAGGAAMTCASTTDANGHFVVLDKAPAGAVRVTVTAKASTDAATVQSADLGSMTLVTGTIANAGNVTLRKGREQN